jgi:hypothetical protein
MDELMEVVALILGEEEKLRVEQNRDKWRIRAESRELVVAVQLFTITPALCLVDFKKLRGSALGICAACRVSPLLTAPLQSLRACTRPHDKRRRSAAPCSRPSDT